MNKGVEMILIGILCIAVGAWIFRMMYIHLMLRLEKTVELRDSKIICSLITLILMIIQIMIGLCSFSIGIYNLIY